MVWLSYFFSVIIITTHKTFLLHFNDDTSILYCAIFFQFLKSTMITVLFWPQSFYSKKSCKPLDLQLFPEIETMTKSVVLLLIFLYIIKNSPIRYILFLLLLIFVFHH